MKPSSSRTPWSPGQLLPLIGLMASLWACDGVEHPSHSVLGTWLATEEQGGGVRRYNVIIEANPTDSTQITLINFHNLGFGVDTYARMHDTVIAITGVSNPMHSITGTGHVKRDFSAMRWEYSYSGPQPSPHVEAWFQRP